MRVSGRARRGKISPRAAVRCKCGSKMGEKIDAEAFPALCRSVDDRGGCLGSRGLLGILGETMVFNGEVRGSVCRRVGGR